jgi:hypothetical protein
MIKATFSREEWEALAEALPHNTNPIRNGIETATGGRTVGPRALIGIRLSSRVSGEILTRAGRLGFCINVRPA